MLELLERLIAFKYSCKLNHWKTNEYAKHLLFDRLQEDIDDLVDNIAEEYFMLSAKQNELDKEIFNIEYIDRDLVKLSMEVKEHIEMIVNKNSYNQGILSLLGNISESFDGKIALLKLKRRKSAVGKF